MSSKIHLTEYLTYATPLIIGLLCFPEYGIIAIIAPILLLILFRYFSFLQSAHTRQFLQHQTSLVPPHQTSSCITSLVDVANRSYSKRGNNSLNLSQMLTNTHDSYQSSSALGNRLNNSFASPPPRRGRLRITQVKGPTQTSMLPLPALLEKIIYKKPVPQSVTRSSSIGVDANSERAKSAKIKQEIDNQNKLDLSAAPAPLAHSSNAHFLSSKASSIPFDVNGQSGQAQKAGLFSGLSASPHINQLSTTANTQLTGLFKYQAPSNLLSNTTSLPSSQPSGLSNREQISIDGSGRFSGLSPPSLTKQTITNKPEIGGLDIELESTPKGLNLTKHSSSVGPKNAAAILAAQTQGGMKKGIESVGFNTEVVEFREKIKKTMTIYEEAMEERRKTEEKLGMKLDAKYKKEYAKIVDLMRVSEDDLDIMRKNAEELAKFLQDQYTRFKTPEERYVIRAFMLKVCTEAVSQFRGRMLPDDVHRYYKVYRYSLFFRFLDVKIPLLMDFLLSALILRVPHLGCLTVDSKGKSVETYRKDLGFKDTKTNRETVQECMARVEEYCLMFFALTCADLTRDNAFGKKLKSEDREGLRDYSWLALYVVKYQISGEVTDLTCVLLHAFLSFSKDLHLQYQKQVETGQWCQLLL
eukprot:TRINITY_DN3203_c0_g1_i1.p1 TRINITY_DN3203_c0_g1~~TRINITY_DN3203_c0_g1_i1.p1  ORF type:complete len:640 (-),score=40.38 TRINITY_DN3203_c0_g1_i1:304-2223(-)